MMMMKDDVHDNFLECARNQIVEMLSPAMLWLGWVQLLGEISVLSLILDILIFSSALQKTFHFLNRNYKNKNYQTTYHSTLFDHTGVKLCSKIPILLNIASSTWPWSDLASLGSRDVGGALRAPVWLWQWHPLWHRQWHQLWVSVWRWNRAWVVPWVWLWRRFWLWFWVSGFQCHLWTQKMWSVFFLNIF